MLGDAPKVDGTDTVPTSLGLTEGARVGPGVGVEVETSIGVGIGVSVGLGLCPNASNATRRVVKANPPASNCFRITS